MHINPKGTQPQSNAAARVAPSQVIYGSRDKLTNPSMTQESLLAALQNHVTFKEQSK